MVEAWGEGSRMFALGGKNGVRGFEDAETPKSETTVPFVVVLCIWHP